MNSVTKEPLITQTTTSQLSKQFGIPSWRFHTAKNKGMIHGPNSRLIIDSALLRFLRKQRDGSGVNTSTRTQISSLRTFIERHQARINSGPALMVASLDAPIPFTRTVEAKHPSDQPGLYQLVVSVKQELVLLREEVRVLTESQTGTGSSDPTGIPLSVFTTVVDALTK